MTVNKEEISQARRKKACAKDSRGAAIATGGIALFFMIAVGSLFVVTDLSRIFTFLSQQQTNTVQKGNESDA